MEPTVEFAAARSQRIVEDAPTLEFAEPNVVARAIQTTGKTTRAFDEATRTLLQRRLQTATALLVCVSIVFWIVSFVTEHSPLVGSIVRALEVAVLASALLALHKRRDLSLRGLRMIETTVVAVPIVEVLRVTIQSTGRLLAEGNLAELPVLRCLLAMVLCMTMTLYAIYIPSSWKRTACVTGAIVGIPILTVLIQSQMHAQLRAPDVFRTDILLPTVCMMILTAAITSLGARIVHSIRREVQAAKTYGQYELLEKIGAGGMGVVYKARHRMLKRPAAIKLIKPELAFSDASLTCFEREVQISATLDHWNTVQVFDYGRTDTGEFYYVMEYLKGVPLDEKLRRGSRLPSKDAKAICIQLCDGLEQAHQQGMIHRDLKPANIFLAEIGGHHAVVKVLDFGLAIFSQDSPSSLGISGTPNYMSPEQIRGEDLDPRSDIYAIGCILYECLIGFPPFKESSAAEVLKGHLHIAPDLSQFHEDDVLAVVIDRCTQKSRDDRYASVSELRTQLLAP